MAAAARPASARPAASAATGRVRWDRLGRITLLVVLVGVVYLYVGPARSLVATWQESRAKGAEVQRLQAENAQLRDRRAALQDPRTLEREARELGMIRPGERAYVVKGLPSER